MSALRDSRLVALAATLAVALVATYLALGGSSYEPSEVRDPCEPRPWREPEGLEESAEQFGLSALDGAACELRVTRETLAVAIASEETRQEFIEEYGVTDERWETAIRAGLLRAVDDAEEAGAISSAVAVPLRAVFARIPVEEGIALIEDATAVFEDAQGLLGRGGELLEGAEGALRELLP